MLIGLLQQIGGNAIEAVDNPEWTNALEELRESRPELDIKWAGAMPAGQEHDQ